MVRLPSHWHISESRAAVGAGRAAYAAAGSESEALRLSGTGSAASHGGRRVTAGSDWQHAGQCHRDLHDDSDWQPG